MAGFSGEYSVALEDLSTGQRWLYNADRLYHPASTLKVAVALYALEQYRTGTIGWQDLVEYTEEALREVADRVVTLATAEDLPAHGQAVTARIPSEGSAR